MKQQRRAQHIGEQYIFSAKDDELSVLPSYFLDWRGSKTRCGNVTLFFNHLVSKQKLERAIKEMMKTADLET